MARMEFLDANFLNTTSMVDVDSGTSTVQYLFNRNPDLGFSTVGYTGVTTTVLDITLTTARVVSHLLLQNHNLKDFSVYYNGTTTNSLYSTTTNSATDSYISFNSVTVSSIHIAMRDTIISGVERTIGELVLTERLVQFERNPSVAKWKPMIFRKQVEHEMPDGGVVLFNVRDKYRAVLSWLYVSTTFRDALFDIYDAGDPFYFLPFPTTTVWDGSAHEVVWPGDFDFKHSTNDKAQGFSGSIPLKETPSG